MRPFVVFALVSFLILPAYGQTGSKRERARLPQWKKFPEHIFFRDAFKEGLVGQRPTKLGQPSSKSLVVRPSSQQPEEIPRGFSWSRLVSSTTLEDEVKSLQIQVQKTITTPSRFSAGGYLEARKMFTELATLFAVVAEYDADVRWKKEAVIARELFARAAANTKTTSIQAFNESRERKRDLEELVRGGTLTSRKTADEMKWELIHRGSLMKRFTQCYDEGLAVWTANEDDFKKNTDNIKRESELLLLFTQVLTQDEMEDGEDEDYEAYCRQLSKSVQDVIDALQVEDADSARKATAEIGQACTACHDDYRG